MSVAELKELDDKSLVHRELQLERELMEARFRTRLDSWRIPPSWPSSKGFARAHAPNGA